MTEPKAKKTITINWPDYEDFQNDGCPFIGSMALCNIDQNVKCPASEMGGQPEAPDDVVFWEACPTDCPLRKFDITVCLGQLDPRYEGEKEDDRGNRGTRNTGDKANQN